MEVRVVNNITKEYPYMIKVLIFKEPRYFTYSDNPKRQKCQVEEDYTPKFSSLSRTKTLIRDYILCNDFEYFATFTFDPAKCDSFKFANCWSKMSVWLHHQRDLSREKGIEFKYLIVPEQHKSGRWHFHCLFSGYTSTLKATKHVTATMRPVFNITSFRSGFTTAVPIDSKESVATYVSKYITKDFIKSFNQRRFFCSRNLVRPTKEINSSIFSKTLPVFRKKVAENLISEEYQLFI